jgi:hypothetical protein
MIKVAKKIKGRKQIGSGGKRRRRNNAKYTWHQGSDEGAVCRCEARRGKQQGSGVDDRFRKGSRGSRVCLMMMVVVVVVVVMMMMMVVMVRWRW